MTTIRGWFVRDRNGYHAISRRDAGLIIGSPRFRMSVSARGDAIYFYPVPR